LPLARLIDSGCCSGAFTSPPGLEPRDEVGSERKKRRMSIPASASAWINKATVEQAQESPPDSELAALTQAARRGSETAFAAIFERFQSPIVNYIYRLVGDWEAANDLAQDTFLKAYGALPN